MSNLPAIEQVKAIISPVINGSPFSYALDFIISFFQRIENNQTSLDYLLPELEKFLQRGGERISDLAFEIKDAFPDEMMDAYEAQAQIYTEALNEKYENYTSKEFFENLNSQLVKESDSEKLKELALNIVQWFVGEKEDKDLIDFLTKSKNVKGMGLSEEVSNSVLGVCKKLSMEVSSNNIGQTIVGPDMLNYLLNLGFSAEKIFTNTKKFGEALSATRARESASYEKTNIVTEPLKTGETQPAAPDLNSLLNQLSKDLGYDDNNDTKSQS